MGIWHVCKGKSAGCILDEYHFLKGMFPGERKFLVETSRGDWKIKILFYLVEMVSPGKETEVIWYEPGCTDEYRFQLSKYKLTGDLFEQAGRDQIFEVEQKVTESGDHLISVWSDAICSYLLKIEIH